MHAAQHGRTLQRAASILLAGVLVSANGNSIVHPLQNDRSNDELSLLQLSIDADPASNRTRPRRRLTVWEAMVSRASRTLVANKTEPAYVPINSAGHPKSAAQQLVDVILLIVCLLVPFGLYLVIKLVEMVQESSERPKTPTTPNRQPRRFGSTYHLEPVPTNLTLTPLQVKEAGPVEAENKDGTWLQNALCGLSTSMAALPDAISFSFITGVSPLNGIWAGVFMGLSAALVGGRPGMISSASAATAVVLADISTDPTMGMGPMALCVFIVGILQLLAGALRLSRFITMVPHPVMLGFVNGLAIVMVRAQLRQFHHQGDGPWVDRDVIVSMVITALFAMSAALAWSRVPRIGRLLPAPLASVILTGVFSYVLKSVLPRRSLEDVAGSATFRGGWSTLPPWNFPPAGVDWSDHHMLLKVVSIAVRFAIVGILESLMTQSLIDQITGTSGSARMECFGQGVGNILSALFGTQGGCALIAQSLMNVGSGGRTRLSGIVMALAMGLCVVVLAPVMAHIPVAALVGLITLISLNTFAWGSIELLVRVDLVDAVVVVVVTVVTVWKDLAVAVVTGVIISGLGFAWHAATDMAVDTSVDTKHRRVFALRGPLFFGSAMNFKAAVIGTKMLEDAVVLEFHGRVVDISGVDAIEKTVQHLQEAGKKVYLKRLTSAVLEQLPLDMRAMVEEEEDEN